MSSSLRRGTLAASTLVLAVATLTACGAGKDAATQSVRPDNAAVTKDGLKLQNVNVVTASNDTTETSAEGPATVTLRIYNGGETDEVLRSVTVDSSGEKAELSPAKGEKELKVPAGGFLKLGGKNEAEALLPDVKKAKILDGNAQALTFDFSRTGKVGLKATVVASSHYYASVGPTVSPSESAGEKKEGAESGAGQSASGGESGQPAEGGEHAGH